MANNTPEGIRKVPHGPAEWWRKFLVSLKRRPQMIPLVALVVAFIFYSFNLTKFSDTTAKIQGPNMGLAGFAVMLFSMLSFMCFLNAFPYRKKPNIPMVVIFFVMLGIICFADIYYSNTTFAAVVRPDNPIIVDESTIYIYYAEWYSRIHVLLVGIAAALTALLPVYSKLLRKINTSIEVEGNQDMGAIDISGED